MVTQRVAQPAQHDGWRQTMAWRLSGRARVERIVATGRTQRLTLTGGILPLAMIWHGIVLAPGWLAPVAPFSTGLSTVMPMEVWAVFAFGVGAAQFSGYVLTYLGLMAPMRRMRIAAAALLLAYFVMIGTTSALSGFAFGPVIYFVVAVLATRDLLNAADAD